MLSLELNQNHRISLQFTHMDGYEGHIKITALKVMFFIYFVIIGANLI